MLLGAIADDLTGATDLALMLTRGGMRTVQVMDVPTSSRGLDAFDAVVVALKSRTNPPEEAVTWSLASADALLALGAEHIGGEGEATPREMRTAPALPSSRANTVKAKGVLAGVVSS